MAAGGVAREVFCFKMLGTRGIHRGFTLPQHTWDCNKIEKSSFLGLLICYLGNPPFMTPITLFPVNAL